MLQSLPDNCNFLNQLYSIMNKNCQQNQIMKNTYICEQASFENINIFTCTNSPF